MRQARAVATDTWAAGLVGGAEFAAVVEAAVLARALQARQLGLPEVVERCDFGRPAGLGPDLVSEAEWLARVSGEFARLVVRDRAGKRSFRSSVGGGAARGGLRGERPFHGWRDGGELMVGEGTGDDVMHIDCCLDGQRAPMEARARRRRFVRRTCSEW
jgi:hypothetical protein